MLASAGIQTFNGPEVYLMIVGVLGEAPELGNFFVAAGFNSAGIQSAGGGDGACRLDGSRRAPIDLWDVDIRRMQPFQANRSYLQSRLRNAWPAVR